MDDDTTEPFGFPAIGRKRPTVGFGGGRLTSDGGVMLLAVAERELGIRERLAARIADPSERCRSFTRQRATWETAIGRLIGSDRPSSCCA
jgi:hypothetical protein